MIFTIIFFILMLTCVFATGAFYNNLYKYNFETVILEKNDSGESNFYRIHFPDYYDLHNHKYTFRSLDYIVKKSLVTGREEDIPRNSPEGCLVSNIRYKNFAKIFPSNNTFNIYIETNH